MKIKDCFILRNIAGINTVVPASASSNFDGIITLNDTGVFMWNILAEGCTLNELIKRVTEEYDIDAHTAEKDINVFIEKLKSIDVFE